MKNLARFLFLIGMLATAACIPHPRPMYPHNPNNPMKVIAVLPMKNDTTDVDGQEMVRQKMVEMLAEHSYVVKDLKETDQILRDRMGITLGGQLNLTTAQKLGEELGVQGVLYGTLMDFDETTTGAYNVKKVRAKFKLVNTADGQTFWANGLGVKSEMRMQGAAGTVATAVGRATDDKDKDAPWVLLETTSTGSDSLGKSLAIGLGSKLLSKAAGTHLQHESEELARRVLHNIPWGPGSGGMEPEPVPQRPMVAMPEVKMPPPPSFGYMDWEGKRDFSAVIFSTTVNKTQHETIQMDIPIAIAGRKVRMDMDMAKMSRGREMPPTFSKMVMLHRGDRETGYTLYPNAKKFMVHTPAEREDHERPRVEKTRIGPEKIGRYHTEKFRVKIFYRDGRIEEGFIWNAPELGGLTIKSEVENQDYRITTELRDIVMRTPAPALFEIPPDFTEAKNVMELMSDERGRKR